MNGRRIRRTTVLILSLMAFLIGLALARTHLYVGFGWVWLALFLSIATLKQPQILRIVAVGLLALSLGWWRGSQVMARLEPYQDLKNQIVILQVKADSDGVYGDNTQLIFDAANVEVIKPYDQTVPGKVKVGGFGEQAVYRGDIVQVEGKLYPTRGSRQASVSYAELKVLGRNDSFIDSVRLRFIAGMQSVLPEPLASFGLGLLIGQRTTLPDNVSSQLAIVGLTHIIAVSGYNLTIIIRAVRRIGKKRSKYQITILSMILIVGFLLVTGLSASIVRAAIVSTLSLVAWYYGRTFRPLLLLMIAAVVTAGWNPLYLWSDIGWYLSFLAFYGVLVLVPLFVRRIYGSKREPKPLTYLLLETTAAQLMTAPLILYIFGQASMVAIFSNLLIVPMVPLAMLLALVAGLAGMLVPLVGGWLAWPAQIILTYMLDVVQLLSRVPHAAIKRSLPILSLITLYVSLAFVSFTLWLKAPKTARITDKEMEII